MIERACSAELQAHLDGTSTTTCRLLKFTLTNGQKFGITTLDRDVEYSDDGDSPGFVYIASNGFDPSTFAADTGLAVDNAEAYALISDEVPGITQAMVDAGELDDAQWKCMLVNFEDLTMGHMILGAGDVGDVSTRQGMLFIPELLSYAMRLKAPIGGVWSIRCRAIFGTPADSQTGCGVDLAPLWVMGTVSAVGAESDRVFTGSNVEDGGPAPYPGVVQFLTGANAGREFDTESIDGLVVELAETTNYAMQVGDTYRIRPDCNKSYLDDCIGIWSNGPNFKGEPLIPVGDSAEVLTPSSQTPKTPKLAAG